MTTARTLSLGKSLHAWMQLLRPPNLFTVPGDPLAGLLLAHTLQGTTPHSLHAAWPVLSALLLYMAGLIGNDLADLRVDARERPKRPLPSHRIRPRTAWAACLILTAAGLFSAHQAGTDALLCALLLTALIFAYNFTLKHIPIIGPLAMGACRGTSLLLGATAVATPVALPLWIATLILTLYITAVSLLASREMHEESSRGKRWAPAALLPAGWATLALAHPPTPIFGGLAALSCLWALWISHRLGSVMQPARTPRLIGAYIRNLLLIQAALCALCGPTGWICAAFLLAAIPASTISAKMFYAS
ncbi:MAG: UbiA family prenyltransferase [Kiritimatiellae bacterium]|nr:UbiA family prenyltransferase [Kiritimatiellia bacterium]